jgi:hypothetical protein
VRFPESVRFTPEAAQRRFESTCRGSFFSLNERDELLSFSTRINGFPLLTSGFKSLTETGFPAKAKLTKTDKMAHIATIKETDICFMVLLLT